MISPISVIINKATRKENEPIDIHTYPAHERTQSHWEKINARFAMSLGTQGVKDGWRLDYAPMPNNHFLLNKSDNILQTIPSWFTPLITISHTKFGQWATSNQFSQAYGIKHIHYEHTWPRHEWDNNTLEQIKQMKSDLTVFISQQSLEAWGCKDESNCVVIPHAVDTNLFKPDYRNKKQVILACNNDWIGRGSILGFDLFQEIVMKNNMPHMIVGDTPGLSKPAKNVYDLACKYNQANIFVNFARESPLPTVLIESMACGCVPVSLDVCMCSELIENGVNGFKSNDNKEIKGYLEYLLAKPEECKRMGDNARKTIIDRFPLDKYIKTWNDIFQNLIK